jgi:hypothetical protein
VLSEEEPICLMLYGNSQKMMEGPKILHGEFSLEDRYGLLQKCYARCGEDNIINIKQQVYHICINKEVSDLASTKPKEVMYVVNQLYQAQDACFSPYRDLLRRQTRSSYVGSTNLVGWL